MSLVYVFFADGFEEVEALTTVDLLRRAGEDVRMVSIMRRKTVTGSHNISVECDMIFEEIGKTADLLVLPGGLPGTDHLREHRELNDLLVEQYQDGRYVAAICAAPSVFAGLGFLKDRKATSYPGCVDASQCGSYVEEPVAVDGNVITSRGVGTAIPFALALIGLLEGREEADKIAASIVYR